MTPNSTTIMIQLGFGYAAYTFLLFLVYVPLQSKTFLVERTVQAPSITAPTVYAPCTVALSGIVDDRMTT